MDLVEFRKKYLSLVVAGCEWRAFELADPELMADQVFARLAKKRLTLKGLFKALEAEVADAYRSAASKKPIMAVFTGSGTLKQKQSEKTFADQVLDTLCGLPGRETTLLQSAYWDGPCRSGP